MSPAPTKTAGGESGATNVGSGCTGDVDLGGDRAAGTVSGPLLRDRAWTYLDYTFDRSSVASRDGGNLLASAVSRTI